jgi:aryl-alcohol dehydrogenase-like predicted oxidoreductase
MVFRSIKGTDLNVSAICLGGVALSAPNDADKIFALLDRFTAWGGNMIDSANVYGKWLPGGRNTSEINIGTWLKARQNRHEVLIGTKGGHPELSEMDRPRLSQADMTKDLDESLAALQTDYIDLYWLHRDDANTPIPVILEYLNGFVKAGKIRFFGCSNWRPARIEEALRYAADHGIQGFCANQLMWSLAVPNPETFRDLVPMDGQTLQMHRKTGLPSFAYMSLANGFFGKLAKGGLDALSDQLKGMYYNDRNLARFRKAQILAEEMYQSVTAIAVSYLISQPLTTIPIAGCRTVAQLEDIMPAGDILLDEKVLRDLEQA